MLASLVVGISALIVVVEYQLLCIKVPVYHTNQLMKSQPSGLHTGFSLGGGLFFIAGETISLVPRLSN